MRITIRQSGGFAGVDRELAAVDTRELGPDAARRLEERVREAGFFTLPSTLEAEGIGADFVRYRITIDEGGRVHDVAFEDDGSPRFASLRALVEEALQWA
jgi:hypothetical protein